MRHLPEDNEVCVSVYLKSYLNAKNNMGGKKGIAEPLNQQREKRHDANCILEREANLFFDAGGERDTAAAPLFFSDFQCLDPTLFLFCTQIDSFLRPDFCSC